MSIESLLMSQAGLGGDVAEGVSFDGDTDYLSRSSDLVGNTDSKTFTFSAWLYKPVEAGSEYILDFYNSADTTKRFSVLYSDASITINGKFSDATQLNAVVADDPPSNTFIHFLASFDMADQANSRIFINDVEYSFTGTFNDSLLGFAPGGNVTVSTNAFNFTPARKQRLSNVFLDYTYRDLSIEANRRLFITEDLKPASGQAALSPILYLPLTDADSAGVNEGTGGDFTVNGVLDTAQRGPNQNNCVASEFDGSADDLTIPTTTLSLVDGNKFTASVILNHRETTSEDGVFAVTSGAAPTEKLVLRCTASSEKIDLTIFGYDPSNSVAINARLTAAAPTFSIVSVQISIDLSDPLNRHIILNGLDVTSDMSFFTYANVNFDLTPPNSPTFLVGSQRSTASRFQGDLGEFYFDTTYTDLATDNPFWDADNNLPKPVRQVLDETGNTPLIAMPIEASNAGLNLGTGGDFTVNSGPFVGARGGSEFWARSANFDGTTGYLSRGTLAGVSDSKQLSFVAAIKPDSLTTPEAILYVDGSGLTYAIKISKESNDTIQVVARNSANSIILNAQGSLSVSAAGNWTVVICSFDLTDTAKRQVYINDVLDTTTWSTYTDDNIFFSGDTVTIGSTGDIGSFFSGDESILYLVNDYIDFSQEENRNLFIDQLGYPKDLSKQIEDELIPEPLIYMPFDDPDDLGFNAGTGGDFTVNGTVDPGADVDPNA